VPGIPGVNMPATTSETTPAIRSATGNAAATLTGPHERRDGTTY
jgi:hypothetical protein